MVKSALPSLRQPRRGDPGSNTAALAGAVQRYVQHLGALLAGPRRQSGEGAADRVDDGKLTVLYRPNLVSASQPPRKQHENESSVKIWCTDDESALEKPWFCSQLFMVETSVLSPIRSQSSTITMHANAPNIPPDHYRRRAGATRRVSSGGLGRLAVLRMY